MAPVTHHSKPSSTRPSSAGIKSVIGKSPDQVNRRNARERKRVEQINNGYRDLALILSQWPRLKNKKISKVETLRCAVEYIQHLESILKYGSDFDDTTSMAGDEAMNLNVLSPSSIATYSPGDHNTSSSSSTVSSFEPTPKYLTKQECLSPSGRPYHPASGYNSCYSSPDYGQSMQVMATGVVGPGGQQNYYSTSTTTTPPTHDAYMMRYYPPAGYYMTSH